MFILSAAAIIFLVAVACPRTRKKLPQLSDSALMTQTSDLLCLGVFGYFFLSFIVTLYPFMGEQNNVFQSKPLADWFDVICMSFALAAFFLAIYWCLAGAVRGIILFLRWLYYLISRNKINHEKKLRFIKSLQFYYAFLAIIMICWFVVMSSFNWLLPLLLIAISMSAILVSWQKIRNIYDFFHDVMNNDARSYQKDSFFD